MIASRLVVVDWPRPLVTGMMAWVVLLVVGCSPTATPNVASHESALDAGVIADSQLLLELMRQRLLVMHEVARWKWHHQQPITDSAREAALLKQTGQRARELGLDEEFAIAFMKAQITAGKQLQQQDMEGWQTQPPSRNEPFADLARELRPKIDQLNVDLLSALAHLAPHLDDEQVRRRLSISAAEAWSGVGFSDEVRATALKPLLTSGNK